jgi:hypothetical protein
MGTWGTGISSNDTFGDVYNEFFNRYDAGESVEAITLYLIHSYSETIEEEEDGHNFWYALAKAQWECQALSVEVLQKVEHSILSGADLASWKRLGARDVDLKKREGVLEQFLNKLKTVAPSARKRKRQKSKQAVFRKGDCITYKLANGRYGGAVVLESNDKSRWGLNLIAITRINQAEKPDEGTFANSEVMIVNYANWQNEVAIKWYNPINHKAVAPLLEVCGQLKVEKEYLGNQIEFGFVMDFKTWIIDLASNQLEYEKQHLPPSIQKPLKFYL